MKGNDIIPELFKKIATIENAVLFDKTFLTLEEFCTYLGISLSTGYKIMSARKIRRYSPGGKKIYILKDDADAYIKAHPIKSMDDLQNELNNI